MSREGQLSNHKTKIVCTLGPVSNSYEMIRKLALAGMDVVRLNFSYGTYPEFRKLIGHIRRVEKELRKPIGILQDLQGPKIRLGRFGQPIQVKAGDHLVFCSGKSGMKGVPIVYPHLEEDLKKGHRILIGDGGLSFLVEKVDQKGVYARAMSSGTIKPFQGAHFFGGKLQISAPTVKDLKDFQFGLEQKVDFIALSFVKSSEDLEKLRRRMRGSQRKPLLVSKIETAEAIENLDDILKVGDGTLVARGDLGLEMGLEEIPLLQKRIIHRASYFGKFVITATQMLESMIEKEGPTRAEVTDIANSVLDGTDAVLLSGETAAGKFPVQAVETMARVLGKVEKEFDLSLAQVGSGDFNARMAFSLAEAARDISDESGIDRIVPFTYSGSTALRISKFRPLAWILAMTPNLESWRKMALFWGVHPIMTKMVKSTDEMFMVAERELKRLKLKGVSKSIILVAGIPMKKTGITNLLKVHEI